MTYNDLRTSWHKTNDAWAAFKATFAAHRRTADELGRSLRADLTQLPMPAGWQPHIVYVCLGDCCHPEILLRDTVVKRPPITGVVELCLASDERDPASAHAPRRVLRATAEGWHDTFQRGVVDIPGFTADDLRRLAAPPAARHGVTIIV